MTSRQMFSQNQNCALLGRAACLAMALLLAPGLSTGKSRLPAIAAPAGLSEVRIAGFQRSFIRPGADIATPRSVCVNSGELTFAADSPRKIYGRLISQQDLRDLQKRFSDAVRTEFAKAFRDQGGYKLAGGGGDANCELQVVVSVQDLHLNVPEVTTPASTRSYSRSVGWLRIRVDVMDQTGAVLLAQAHGVRTDPDHVWSGNAEELLNESHRITEIDNIAFARAVGRIFGEHTRTRLLAQR